MPKAVSAQIQDHFADLTDPRSRPVTHPLINIVAISLCAVVAGADDFVAIAKWARSKRDWLDQFLDLSNGIPSHDRFNAILGALNPYEFERCLLSWVSALHEITDGQIIAIDGKTLRRSFDAASSKAAIHMVSAWATASHISLGQVVADAKSNEITAIPKLLEMLAISGCFVTIDAMGCQTEIAAKIIEAEADYILAVKGNQPTLFHGIEQFFMDQLESDFADVSESRFFSSDDDHGRDVERAYYVCPIPENLPDAERWVNLKAIGLAINDTTRDGKTSCEFRYYILSKKLSARKFATAVRGHWSIENRLHWQLDVTFGEDQSRIRRGHADANFSILRRAALSLLKNNHTHKVGIKNRRLMAAWNDDFLRELLFGK